MTGNPLNEPKTVLHRYFTGIRDAVLWKLDGLSEYDARRPLTPTGTNVLGVVKHLACVELGYFGWSFGRATDIKLAWYDEDAEPNADMFATESETREEIVAFYRQVREISDATITELPLDAPATVVAGRTQPRHPAGDPGPHDRRDEPARGSDRHRPRADRRRGRHPCGELQPA